MLKRTVLVGLAALAVSPVNAWGQKPRYYVPADSVGPVQLVQEWEAAATWLASTGGNVGTAARRAGISAALGRYESDPARAAAVRDELERVVFRSNLPDVQTRAIRWLVRGYNISANIPGSRARAEGADTRALAMRLERIYKAVDGVRAKYAVLEAVATLGGSGRHYALTWLEPLIVQRTEAQSFPQEAFEAMRAAANLDRPGLALVVRLRNEGLIKNREARFRSGFLSVEGGG